MCLRKGIMVIVVFSLSEIRRVESGLKDSEEVLVKEGEKGCLCLSILS